MGFFIYASKVKKPTKILHHERTQASIGVHGTNALPVDDTTEAKYLQLVAKYGVLKEDYEQLLRRVADVGLPAYGMLSRTERDKLMILEFLRSKHGKLKVGPQTLYTLSPNMRQECRDYMYLKLGDNPFAKQRIDEALGKPKKSRKRQEDNNYSAPKSQQDLTEGESLY